MSGGQVLEMWGGRYCRCGGAGIVDVGGQVL